jgi:acyl-CoA dehydrogenase
MANFQWERLVMALGAVGSMEDAFERMLRDARLGPIGGGTDEIMREILGKTLQTH